MAPSYFLENDVLHMQFSLQDTTRIYFFLIVLMQCIGNSVIVPSLKHFIKCFLISSCLYEIFAGSAPFNSDVANKAQSSELCYHPKFTILKLIELL